MSSPPTRPRSSLTIREKRREFYLGLVAKCVGGASLVLMVAAVFHVAVSRQWERKKGVSPAQPIPPPAARADAAATAASPEARPAVPQAASVSPREARALLQYKAAPVISGIESIEAKQEAIREGVGGFFAATSMEEKLRWSRDPARVKSLMAEHYKSHVIKPLRWKALNWARPVAEPGYRLGYVQAEFEDAEPVAVIIEELAGGRIVVDWESAVRYGEMSWRQFLQTRPSQPTLLRVLASWPEQGGQAVDSGLQALSIRHPASADALQAEFDPSDIAMVSLVEQLRAGQGKDVPVILRLCFTRAISPSPVAQIAAVEGRGWLILPPKRS